MRRSPRQAIQEWLAATEPQHMVEDHLHSPSDQGQKDASKEGRRTEQSHHVRKLKHHREAREDVASKILTDRIFTSLQPPFQIFPDETFGLCSNTLDHAGPSKRRHSLLTKSTVLETAPIIREEHSKGEEHFYLHRKRRKAANPTDFHSNPSSSSRDLGLFVSPRRDGRKSTNKYERRARHKTKEDRYELKQDQKEEESSMQEGRKSKRHSRKEKSGTALMQNFSARNVARDRLTLNQLPKVGMFNKGRASSPVRRKGLPDLAFSEISFLRPRRDRPDETSKPINGMTQGKKANAVIEKEEMSRFFTLAKEPLTERDQNASFLHRDHTFSKTLHKSPRAPDRLISRNTSPAASELPRRPFLGFGQRGPDPISPMRSSGLRSERTADGCQIGRDVVSPNQSSSYFTWSRSGVQSNRSIRHTGCRNLPESPKSFIASPEGITDHHHLGQSKYRRCHHLDRQTETNFTIPPRAVDRQHSAASITGNSRDETSHVYDANGLGAGNKGVPKDYGSVDKEVHSPNLKVNDQGLRSPATIQPPIEIPELMEASPARGNTETEALLKTLGTFSSTLNQILANIKPSTLDDAQRKRITPRAGQVNNVCATENPQSRPKDMSMEHQAEKFHQFMSDRDTESKQRISNEPRLANHKKSGVQHNNKTESPATGRNKEKDEDHVHLRSHNSLNELPVIPAAYHGGWKGPGAIYERQVSPHEEHAGELYWLSRPIRDIQCMERKRLSKSHETPVRPSGSSEAPRRCSVEALRTLPTPDSYGRDQDSSLGSAYQAHSIGGRPIVYTNHGLVRQKYQENSQGSLTEESHAPDEWVRWHDHEAPAETGNLLAQDTDGARDAISDNGNNRRPKRNLLGHLGHKNRSGTLHRNLNESEEGMEEMGVGDIGSTRTGFWRPHKLY